jgi:hypothetical protein
VTDRNDSGPTGSVEKFPPIRSENVATVASDGLWIRLPEVAGKEGVAHARQLAIMGSAILADIPPLRIPEVSSVGCTCGIQLECVTKGRFGQLH